MKPNDVILNTDFYHLSNDGSAYIVLDIPSGTVADYWTMAVFATKSFSVGSPLADYDGLIYDNKSNSWSAGTTKIIEASIEGFENGESYGLLSMWVEIKFWRNSGNNFILQASITGLGGSYPPGERPSILYYLRENLQIRLKIKTFLQPEL